MGFLDAMDLAEALPTLTRQKKKQANETDEQKQERIGRQHRKGYKEEGAKLPRVDLLPRKLASGVTRRTVKLRVIYLLILIVALVGVLMFLPGYLEDNSAIPGVASVNAAGVAHIAGSSDTFVAWEASHVLS